MLLLMMALAGEASAASGFEEQPTYLSNQVYCPGTAHNK